MPKIMVITVSLKSVAFSSKISYKLMQNFSSNPVNRMANKSRQS